MTRARTGYKKVTGLVDAYRKVLASNIRDDLTVAEYIARRVAREAANGNMFAVRELRQATQSTPTHDEVLSRLRAQLSDLSLTQEDIDADPILYALLETRPEPR